jgi:hypothetical protein
MDLDTHGLQPATAKFFLEVNSSRMLAFLLYTVSGLSGNAIP